MTKLQELAHYWTKCEAGDPISMDGKRFSYRFANEIGKDIIDMYCRLEILEKAISEIKNR